MQVAACLIYQNSCVSEATVDTVCVRKVFGGFVSSLRHSYILSSNDIKGL